MPNNADRERLLRIISMCIDVERKAVNPFEVEVIEILNILRKYLPHWKFTEDFVLDAEALDKVASIINLQGDWIKHRSSLLYVDPLLMELKIKMIDTQRLVDIFLKTWHPIIEFEGLSRKRVSEAVSYWNQLIPIDERRANFPSPLSNLESISFEELLKQSLISEQSFNKVLKNLWEELKKQVGDKGQISYWLFITADTYEETISRAYLTSFLITYGFAAMEVNPIEEEAFLIPYNERVEMDSKTQSVSMPIPIDHETWERVRGKKFG